MVGRIGVMLRACYEIGHRWIPVFATFQLFALSILQ